MRGSKGCLQSLSQPGPLGLVLLQAGSASSALVVDLRLFSADRIQQAQGQQGVVVA